MRKANTGFPQICLGISKWLWGVVCNRGTYGDMVMYYVAEVAQIHILFWSNLELFDSGFDYCMLEFESRL